MEPATTKPTLLQRTRHEAIEYLFICTYLYVCFGAVFFYKWSVLHGHGIAFEAAGIAIVKALVLGKFVLIAETMKFGDRSRMHRPLVDVLRKALLFVVMLMVLSVIEEVIVGLIHGRPSRVSIGHIADGYLPEAIAVSLLMLLILIPYFAFQEISMSLGKGALLKRLTEPRAQL